MLRDAAATIPDVPARARAADRAPDPVAPRRAGAGIAGQADDRRGVHPRGRRRPRRQAASGATRHRRRRLARAVHGYQRHLERVLLKPPTIVSASSTAARHARRAWIAWVAVCVIWGTTYLGIKVALETIPPFLMGGLRYAAGRARAGGRPALRGRPLPPRDALGPPRGARLLHALLRQRRRRLGRAVRAERTDGGADRRPARSGW